MGLIWKPGRWRARAVLLAFAAAFSVPSGVPGEETETYYIYDDLGRLAKVADPQTGEVATYEYDAAGNILAIRRTTGGLKGPSITRQSETTGDQGKTVCLDIEGQDLLGVTVETGNGEARIHDVRTSETKLHLCVDFSFLSRDGPATFNVKNPVGSTQFTLQVNPVPPTISGIEPTAGPPTRLVSISGTAFSPEPAKNRLMFGEKAGNVLSSTVFSIEATVPADAPAGPTTVHVTVEGRVSNGFPFSVSSATGSPPVVDLLRPAKGPLEGGNILRIMGSGFTTGAKVLLGKREANVASRVGTAELRVVVPSGKEGPVDVRVQTENGDYVVQGGYRYIAGPPLRVSASNPTLGILQVPTKGPRKNKLN